MFDYLNGQIKAVALTSGCDNDQGFDSFTMAEQRRRKLKAAGRRRGITPSKELLCLQDWSIYVTNTNETQINNDNMHSAYACRWQIELMFKLGKSLMQLDSINTTKSYRVIIEIYGKFICMMVLFLLASPVRYQNDKELSFYKACKILIEKASDFIRALHSIYRLKQFLTSFHEDFSLFAIKDTKKKTPLLENSAENNF